MKPLNLKETALKEEEIKRQLKLSKQQNKNERYDYLCSQFNCVNYAIKLEKYTNKLQQENKQLKDNWNKLKECLKDVMNSSNGDDKDFVETILNIMQELEGSYSNE